MSTDDRQNHGRNYGVISRDIGTISLLANGNLCGGGYIVNAGWMTSIGWAYKNGQPPPCHQDPACHYNTSRSYTFYWWTYDDLWPECNNGLHQNVSISHDVWHAVLGPTPTAGSSDRGGQRPVTVTARET